ncbi:MAG: cysteine desulfurase [Chloroflexi bacterium]|nr:cysteine desulfurase [Chloroflexota bacterium]
MKVEALRRQFPIFKRSFNGKELAYLDNAATTQKPGIVIQELTRFYSESNANIHRGAYALSEEATAAYEGARQHVAGLIHARSVQEVVFVRNATEAINLVAYAWGRRNIHPGDRIVLTELEHHSNLVPWQLLAQEREALLEFVPIDGQGRLDLAVLDRLLQQEPKLVAVGHVSNALGTINPVTEIVRKAHAAGARVLVDGAQSVPHQPVDVTEIDADFLAFSGHKMCGPTGIGVLYGKQDVLEAMPPFLGGGDMIRQVQLHESTWNDLPWKFEAGTPHIAGAVGLGAAVKFLQGIGMQAIFVHEQQLLATLLDRLQSLPYVSLYGPSDPAEQAGIVSFTLGHIHAHDVATVLDRHAVAVRSGHHCCQPLMERLHVPATVRASLYLYSTEHEVERLVQGIQDAARIFRLDRAVRGDARG